MGYGRVPRDAAGEGLVAEGGEGRHGRHDEIVGLERVVEGGLELGNTSLGAHVSRRA